MFSFSFVLKTSIAAAVFIYISFYIYTETYVWQCTIFANVFRPIKRQSCDYQFNYGNSKSNRLLNSTVDMKLNIGILMVYDKNYWEGDTNMINRVLLNREMYCKRHGYIMIHANDVPNNSSRPPAWNKLLAVEKYLMTNTYDYILYMDMDMVIMDLNISLERFIATSAKDIIITNDWSGVNTGIWLAKNSAFTKWFLRTAWNQEQLVAKYSLVSGKPHPFEYEQRAFHFLLDSKVWRDRGLPQYRGNITEIRNHFHILPQCAMNSYIIHPLEFRADREVSQYVESDFIIHFAGKKGKIKTDLMDYYLTVAEAQYK